MPAVLIASALLTLHHVFLPAGVALLVAALWPLRRQKRALLGLAALPLVLVAAYLLSRHFALSSVSSSALALVTASSTLSFSRFLYVFVVALLALACIAAARRPPHARFTFLPALLAFALAFSIFEGQEGRGPARWSRRATQLIDDAGFAFTAATSLSPPSPAQAALAAVPAGATVALWLGHPERLDHRRHTLLDLRTPSIARLRQRAPARFARLLATLAPLYLLYELPLVASPTRVAPSPPTPVDDFLSLPSYREVWSGEGMRLLQRTPD